MSYFNLDGFTEVFQDATGTRRFGAVVVLDRMLAAWCDLGTFSHWVFPQVITLL